MFLRIFITSIEEYSEANVSFKRSAVTEGNCVNLTLVKCNSAHVCKCVAPVFPVWGGRVASQSLFDGATLPSSGNRVLLHEQILLY